MTELYVTYTLSYYSADKRSVARAHGTEKNASRRELEPREHEREVPIIHVVSSCSPLHACLSELMSLAPRTACKCCLHSSRISAGSEFYCAKMQSFIICAIAKARTIGAIESEVGLIRHSYKFIYSRRVSLE